jgi:hypothetical protein
MSDRRDEVHRLRSPTGMCPGVDHVVPGEMAINVSSISGGSRQLLAI